MRITQRRLLLPAEAYPRHGLLFRASQSLGQRSALNRHTRLLALPGLIHLQSLATEAVTILQQTVIRFRSSALLPAVVDASCRRIRDKDRTRLRCHGG